MRTSTAFEVLPGRRPLSLNMSRALHRRLGNPRRSIKLAETMLPDSLLAPMTAIGKIYLLGQVMPGG